MYDTDQRMHARGERAACQVRSVEVGGACGAVSGAVRGEIEPMDLPAPGFEISSPIRARGRPKQKAKVNKAKKSTSISGKG
ncbi:hypothetical protein PC121_g11475 [Phytophthora cactorum]|nr:hypothetical protein PC120_g16426 [Phytophthora cactorum]KAG3065057.1 hypothetical protein PC121_g11475 [Phytophthora cactorum]